MAHRASRQSHRAQQLAHNYVVYYIFWDAQVTAPALPSARPLSFRSVDLSVQQRRYVLEQLQVINSHLAVAPTNRRHVTRGAALGGAAHGAAAVVFERIHPRFLPSRETAMRAQPWQILRFGVAKHRGGTRGSRRVALGDVVARDDAERHADVAARTFKQVIQHIFAARRAGAHAGGRLRFALVPLAQNCFDVLPLFLRQLRFVFGLLPKLCGP
jgi:hypothetical protein